MGSRAAYWELFEQYRGYFRRYAARLTRESPIDPDDLLSEVLLKGHKLSVEIEARDFKAYMIAAIQRTYVGECRKLKRLSRWYVEDFSREPALPGPSAERVWQQAVVDKALSKMDPHKQEILLAYDSGLTLRETQWLLAPADTEKAVKSRLMRALREIKGRAGVA